MGCRVSKHESLSEEHTPNTMAQFDSSADIKAKLERKLYLAKETPEPDFDLSGCSLKVIPSGVFILCRVLRKETLDLSKNALLDLKGGGQLNDLHLLRSLDLRYNVMKQIPSELCRLENLRELMISHNKLVRLPDAINQLRNLEILDCSFNQLIEINQLKCMAHLRVLNISGNGHLNVFPTTLSTCDSLIDIIFDLEAFVFPPASVLEQGTIAILNYLTTNRDYEEPDSQQLPIPRKNVHVQHGENDSNNVEMYNEYGKEKKFIELERIAMEKNRFQEEELHQKLQMKREGLLQELLKQKAESDNVMIKMQQEKSIERKKLISGILKADEDSSIIVEKMLTIRTESESYLLENERREHEQILQRLQIQNNSLRKQEVLAAMSDILSDEQRKIDIYQEQRNAATAQILEDDSRANQLLNSAYQQNDRTRSGFVSKILQDEELQKTAVCSLIAKNDSRSWALIEKMRIVESQLVALTHLEVQRRKISVDENLADLSKTRLDLTYVLMDLLAQQERRKKQLMENLTNLETQKESSQNDFWLLQYQKLIDSQPVAMRQNSSGIDPMLGYNLLVNGVIHCLPFLSKICNLKKNDMCDITEMDLDNAGVKNASDRDAILRSIQNYLDHTMELAASAPKTLNANDSKESEADTEDTLMECVICMDKPSKIIFLPCGHLCCCINCQETLLLCPMCRSNIDKRIKVIQP